MSRKKILFIINPISGGKNKEKLPDLIKKTIDPKLFDVEINFTNAAGHARHLAAKPGFDYYIAVGGDGTLNEVASQLINTKAIMGILPMGSGNGLARHMGISMNIEKALKQINSGKVVKIDTCTFNGRPFINMAGVGFDAHIGKMFAESKERGFKTYVIQTLTEFRNYKSQNYRISYGGKETSSEAFLVSFANSSQYGNNAYIAPDADIKDGMLDVCLLKPFKAMDVPEIGFRLFNKSIKQSKFLETFQTKELIINRDTDGVAHLDGEPVTFGKKLEIKVLPMSLNLLVP